MKHDPKTCFENIGCPDTPKLELPRCDGAGGAPVTFLDFLQDPSLWVNGATVRLAGTIHLAHPHPETIVNMAASQPWGAGDPKCEGGGPDYVALQEVVHGRCFGLTVRSDADPGLRCVGDMSRTCCGHLPMGETIVVTGRLELHPFHDGSVYPILRPRAVCKP